jgi:hypothetical protein
MLLFKCVHNGLKNGFLDRRVVQYFVDICDVRFCGFPCPPLIPAQCVLRLSGSRISSRREFSTGMLQNTYLLLVHTWAHGSRSLFGVCMDLRCIPLARAECSLAYDIHIHNMSSWFGGGIKQRKGTVLWKRIRHCKATDDTIERIRRGESVYEC